MKQFWTKCNKFITDGYYLLHCKNCPCGYYAVFGIKYRDIDPITQEPKSDCSWRYDVKPYEVLDNKIFWQYGNFCIQVDRVKGKCGYKKACGYSYENCQEWNEDYTECLKTTIEYSSCYEVEVYNLTGCTESLEDFKMIFYQNCGYVDYLPEIWTYSYGYKYLSWEAEDCVNNYWNREFSKLYLLNFSFVSTIKGQCWWQSVCHPIYEYKTECYTYDDGTQDCYTYADHQTGEGGNCYMMGFDGNDTETHALTVKTGGWYGTDDTNCITYPCYHSDCCVNIGTFASLATTTPHIQQYILNKAEYGVYKGGWYNGSKGTGTTTLTCKNSDNLCCEFSYESHCGDNYYGSMTQATFYFRWGVFSIARTPETPEEAKGVSLELTIKETKTNTGLGNESSETKATVAYLNLPFDTVFEELPLATDVNLLGIVESPRCSNDCKNTEGELKISPYVMFGWAGVTPYEQDVKSHKFDVKIKVLEYYF